MTDSEPGGLANGDTPQAAESNAKPSSGAPRVAKRAHRFLVPVLLVLATIIGIAATFAVWVNRQALNTSNWSSTSSKILEDKQVQTALSAYLVHELFNNVNVLRGSAEGAARAVAAAGWAGCRRGCSSSRARSPRRCSPARRRRRRGFRPTSPRTRSC